MTAPVMDFIVKNGRLLESAETSGPPQIVITQPDANQKTVVTASQVHGEIHGAKSPGHAAWRTGRENCQQLA